MGGDNSHEFNFYDPEGDSAKFEIVHRDLLDCGLTDASMKTLRFPGHRHQMPTVVECAKYGVHFIDGGGTYPWYSLLGVIILPEGIIWETNHGWWSDVTNWYDPEIPYSVMRRGEIVLGGGHPLSTFPLNMPEQFEVVNGVFTQMETLYPQMKYFFPDDYADFCEQSRTWWDVSFASGSAALEFSFYGAADKGQTIVADLADAGSVILPPYVDFQPVDYEIRGNRIFVELPQLPLGYHVVVIGIRPLAGDGALPTEIRLGDPYPNPCDAWITFPVELPHGSQIGYKVMDVLGRIAAEGSVWKGSGYRRITLRVDNLPSGIYVYQLRADKVVKKGKMILLK